MLRQKLLLTGSTGMLGSRIHKALTGLSQFDVYSIGRTNSSNQKDFITCDISRLRDFDTVLNDLRPSLVIHTAADVNVNRSETEREYAYALHVGTATTIASKKFIEKSIYVSTDSVFDGEKGDYSSNDAKNPLNYYALTKSLGEDEFLKSGQNSIIIRTNIIGYSMPLKSAIFEWGLASLQNGQPISGFSNILFNPLYVRTLADLIVNAVLLEDVEKGIYHFGSNDFYTKYDFLKLIARTFELDQSLITPVEAAAIQGVGRPLNTTLNTLETQRKLNIRFPSLEQEMLSIFADINKEYV